MFKQSVEDRCLNADLDIHSLKIEETANGTQKAKVVCTQKGLVK